MSGGPRRGSDSPDLMYISGKTIHTFWAPRQGFQTDIYRPCVRIAAGGPRFPSPIPPFAQALCLSTRIGVYIWLGCSQLAKSTLFFARNTRWKVGRFSKPPSESGNGVTLFATCGLLLRTLHKNRVSRTRWFLGPVGVLQDCVIPRF